jgi:hypothetical protein
MRASRQERTEGEFCFFVPRFVPAGVRHAFRNPGLPARGTSLSIVM